MSHQIFISYASKDRERIQPLVQALEHQGWSVWWDRKIPIGKSFDEVIEEAIDTAKCVIVVWTESSVTSKWVRTEAGEGEQRGVLIPILLDDVEIPLAYKRIETAQLINWDGVSDHPELDVLLEAVSILVSKPLIAKPDRPAPERVEIEQRAEEKVQHKLRKTKADQRPIDKKKETTLLRSVPKWIWISGGVMGAVILFTLGTIINNLLNADGAAATKSPTKVPSPSVIGIVEPLEMPEEFSRTDPISVAAAVLTAYRTRDVISMSGLSLPYNREIWAELAKQGEDHPRYSSLFTDASWRWLAVKEWDGNIDEVRYPSYDEAWVKFGELGPDEVAIVVLYWFDNQWLFEDINSPSAEDFESVSETR